MLPDSPEVTLGIGAPWYRAKALGIPALAFVDSIDPGGRVGELEKQKLVQLEKQGNLAKKPGAFDELFKLALAFLSKP